MRGRWIFFGLVVLLLPSAAFAQTTDTFNYTGGTQTWVVPAGVTSVDIEAWGAQAGPSYLIAISGFEEDGGLGGYASGTLAVTPGDTLNIYVGGKPAGVNGTPVAGGFNGGGQGGRFGGGGGGASDVRVGGTALTDRVIVAGGGGGGNGGAPNHGTGGGGGGLVGISGIGYTGWTGGGGGTQAAGGTAGGNGAQPGQLGLGGATPVYHMAGGGGGYYGGGSAYAAGGGGGSSYIDGVTGGTTTESVQTGDGQVSITYRALVAVDVPTLSEWALVLFAGLIILASGWLLRRRSLA